MILIALFGAFLGVVGILLGHTWLYLTYIMIAGEFMLVYGILIAPRRLKTVIIREAIGQNPNVWVKIVFISDLHLYKNQVIYLMRV